MLAWDGGTSTVLSKRKARQQPTGRFPIGPQSTGRRPCRSGAVLSGCRRPGGGRHRGAVLPLLAHATFRTPKYDFYFVETSSRTAALARRLPVPESGVLTRAIPK
ncbi:hypothetical protein GCM10010298_40440 [Streptomyces microflavus]|nr:hypothetical protein GCM10010298_40440 [Streptomyces microflavus]